MSNFTFSSFFRSEEEANKCRTHLDADDNRLILVTGPAGGGKTAFCRHLEETQPGLYVVRHMGEDAGTIEDAVASATEGKKVLLVVNETCSLKGVEAPVIVYVEHQTRCVLGTASNE